MLCTMRIELVTKSKQLEAHFEAQINTVTSGLEAQISAAKSDLEAQINAVKSECEHIQSL